MIYHQEMDVAVVGGGPAGISACLELARRSDLKVALVEAESRVGGLPRTCGPGFGLRDQHRFLSGPAYARRLAGLLGKTQTRVMTETTVLGLETVGGGERHLLEAASPQGITRLVCGRVILATGCFESSRESRLIPGDRPAGIMTTGTLQQLVKLRGLKPGRRALILGTEAVSLSAVLTLRRAGVEVAGLVEAEAEPCTHPAVMAAFRAAFRFPVYYRARVLAIRGQGRVAGVLLDLGGRELALACDTVIVSGRFRPDAALAESAGLGLDPDGRGPLADDRLRTTLPGVWAAGNLLRGAEMHDLCALEGRAAARSLILDRDRTPAGPERVPVRVAAPIRFAVPHRIALRPAGGINEGTGASLAIQVSKTLLNPTLEVWSGERLIWRKRYRRLIGRTRILLPVERFEWSAVEPRAGLGIRVG